MSIGQTLHEARERAGLSVDEVSERTRIRATVVRAIEADDFALCGGDVYARGHVRAIAAVVGADGPALAAEYDVAHHGPRPSMGEGLEAERAAVKGPSRSRGPSWATAAAVVLVVLIVYGVVQLFASPGSTPSADNAAPGATTQTASPSADSSGSGASTSPPPTSRSTGGVIAARDSVTVRVDATRGASWIRATGISGKTLYEGILQRGRSQEFTDKTQLNFVVGDAGSVDLTVNGAPIGAPGANGAVVRLSFGPQDPAAG